MKHILKFYNVTQRQKLSVVEVEEWKVYSLVEKLNGSFSWTSNAAARILPSFNAAARACSSTSPPLAVLIKNAPTIMHGTNIRPTYAQVT